MTDEHGPWEEDFYEEDFEAQSRRGFTMRHPILLVFVIVGAAFMSFKTWPRAAFYFAETIDCGELSDRPLLRQTAPDKLIPLRHDTYCKLSGTVHQLHALATAKKDGNQPGSDGGRLETMKELEGVKYYVKLAGDSVFAVLPADRLDIHTHRVRQSSLFGYEVNETGRIYDPSQEAGGATTERYLRVSFALPDDKKIFLFDTTQHPEDRWGFLVILILMGLTGTLALFGLIRSLLRRADS